MQLHEALSDISQIRLQMDRSRLFRGYRSFPIACSGLLALLAAAVQPLLAPEPAGQLNLWLALWLAVATVSVIGCAAEMAWRYVRLSSAMQREITWLAVQQFLPALAAGGLLTYLVAAFAPQVGWMLPGLWAVLFSMGVFASCQLLPRATFAVGVFYLAAGLLSLALLAPADGASPFSTGRSAWLMALTFGAGQLMAAGVLYLSLERKQPGNNTPCEQP